MELIQAPEAPTPPAAPDWQKQKDEIHCPLCEYNLRGLSEPRCPECGYRFEWAELLNVDGTRHPFLFEHYPKNNVWSFCRTFLATTFPRKFWRTVTPTQPVKVRRLLIY